MDLSLSYAVCVFPQLELREEQHRYRQYLSEELQKQRREEAETEQLIEEKLKETWTKREEQSRLQREARNRLMNEVMEARRLQIQHKRKEANRESLFSSKGENVCRLTVSSVCCSGAERAETSGAGQRARGAEHGREGDEGEGRGAEETVRGSVCSSFLCKVLQTEPVSVLVLTARGRPARPTRQT